MQNQPRAVPINAGPGAQLAPGAFNFNRPPNAPAPHNRRHRNRPGAIRNQGNAFANPGVDALRAEMAQNPLPQIAPGHAVPINAGPGRQLPPGAFRFGNQPAPPQDEEMNGGIKRRRGKKTKKTKKTRRYTRRR